MVEAERGRVAAGTRLALVRDAADEEVLARRRGLALGAVGEGLVLKREADGALVGLGAGLGGAVVQVEVVDGPAGDLGALGHA